MVLDLNFWESKVLHLVIMVVVKELLAQSIQARVKLTVQFFLAEPVVPLATFYDVVQIFQALNEAASFYNLRICGRKYRDSLVKLANLVDYEWRECDPRIVGPGKRIG